MKSKITKEMLNAVGNLLGSHEIAAKLVPVFEDNMDEFDEEDLSDKSQPVQNYLFFIWVMGFACGLDNAENVNEFLSSDNDHKGELQ
jgi:hypothetical protein